MSQDTSASGLSNTDPQSPRTVDALHLHARDNICIAARDLPEGAEVTAGPHTVRLAQPIMLGHKFAVEPIQRDEPILKYGQTIGFATTDVTPGYWVHTHNLTAGEFQRDYAFATEVPPDPKPITGRTFEGYRRADGRVGTRNYIAVISTVNCSASVSRYIAQRFDAESLKQYPHVDGIMAITHKGGCGMQYDGEGHHQLDRVLAGFARHPNVGAYLLVGLGCEVGTMGHLIEHEGLVQINTTDGPRQPPQLLSIQDCGGTGATVDAGVAAIRAMLPRVNEARRETIPAAELVLGCECGGSDGNSGVTANPALGIASDRLVAAGGTVMLAETPEIYGAEHLLTRRARSREVGQKLVDRIRWWEQYTGQWGVKIDNNPSPGNKAGGLTTIYEKSLGAVAKAGSTALCGVYQYAEPVREKGFVVVDTPGYDPASITGMVASGANVLCFTTGRGSCFGCKPVPSLKISTNTPMYERMIADMDIDAGRVLSGTPLEQVGEEIFEMILDMASGRPSKSELHGVGEEEFLPWTLGPML
jgi:altronate hydrolase